MMSGISISAGQGPSPAGRLRNAGIFSPPTLIVTSSTGRTSSPAPPMIASGWHMVMLLCGQLETRGRCSWTAPPPQKGNAMSLALGDLRMVDCTENLSGPFCSMLLADLGVDVIKVERPGSGDTI